MKKLALTLCLALMLCCFAGCSSHCKEKDCKNEVYEDGYCELHYTLHQAEDVLNALLGN